MLLACPAGETRFISICPLQGQSEEINREHTERQSLERDLEEASSRLAMAHKEIRRLTDELDLARKVQNLCGK